MGQGYALVGVLPITPGPEKRLSRGVLQAADIDVPPLKHAFILLGEILPHHAHQIHVREKARGHGKIRRRAAQRAVPLAKGRFQRIESHRTDYQ